MSPHSPKRIKTLWQIFAIPCGLGLASALGLVAALLGNGVFDGLSWLMLALPVAVAIKGLQRLRPRP